ncbi:zonular occludens toxin domain-containing protein [Pseudomonas aeruginosa]|uniref:zonular occludens toxin domain-containing protein n=1 Tax=Pseudomonas aeruginosa TaxID=287 RepID=UPI0015B9C062|nr:hypothetical protein [Pseudomonas aeruginosa]MBX5682315.1 hypothetical protein [Pseudomonas aeruginosa]MBX5682326.1 hypothetical protein [Pseudomonas aeruginosa]MBX5756232.1 hypothetical protein [Pseudomonas aeruginosa]MBX6077234.1 hypothetical protein [Pseudomonas aeruginosa]
MINLILGQPGGGKSHEAVVYHVVPALNQGRKVITNLALDMDKFKAFLETLAVQRCCAVLPDRHLSVDVERHAGKETCTAAQGSAGCRECRFCACRGGSSGSGDRGQASGA